MYYVVATVCLVKGHRLYMYYIPSIDDDTRVKLQLIPGEPESHYINASFIDVSPPTLVCVYVVNTISIAGL